MPQRYKGKRTRYSPWCQITRRDAHISYSRHGRPYFLLLIIKRKMAVKVPPFRKCLRSGDLDEGKLEAQSVNGLSGAAFPLNVFCGPGTD